MSDDKKVENLQEIYISCNSIIILERKESLQIKMTKLFWSISTGEGGGSSIDKVPGDAPSTRVYFFGLLVYPRVYFWAILVEFSLGNGMLCGNFGQSTV